MVLSNPSCSNEKLFPKKVQPTFAGMSSKPSSSVGMGGTRSRDGDRQRTKWAPHGSADGEAERVISSLSFLKGSPGDSGRGLLCWPSLAVPSTDNGLCFNNSLPRLIPLNQSPRLKCTLKSSKVSSKTCNHALRLLSIRGSWMSEDRKSVV